MSRCVEESTLPATAVAADALRDAAKQPHHLYEQITITMSDDFLVEK